LNLNNRYFSISAEKSKGADVSAPELFISKYLNKHYETVKSLPEDLLRLPSQDECFFLQTDNSFNAFTFVVLVAKHQGIKRLYASTYSINIRVIESLVELHDGGFVDEIFLMVSDSLRKRNPTTVNLMEALFKSRPNIRLKYSWNHSKVTLMQTEFSSFVVEGSGNWSENALYEQYIFLNSKSVFEHREKLFLNSKER